MVSEDVQQAGGWRLRWLALMYTVQGLPYGLQVGLLPAGLRASGYSLSAVSLSRLLFLPWLCKPFIAPVVERSRRTWLLGSLMSLTAMFIVAAMLPGHVDVDLHRQREQLFGCGSVAQMVFQSLNVPFLSVNLAFGLAVTMGCYIAGGVSGAHLNPAVSLAMVVLGRLTLLKMLVYWVAQLLGAFIGAAMVFLMYLDAEKKHSRPWSMETAGIYATYPNTHLSTIGGFFDQVLGTAALLLCILALLDKKNTAPPDGVTPLIIGLVVAVIGMAMGHNCGYAINPARDLGPRLFTLIAGWGRPVFTHGNYWFWVPIIAPLLGGVLGALTYVLFVELHHPSSSDTGTNNKEDAEKHYDL